MRSMGVPVSFIVAIDGIAIIHILGLEAVILVRDGIVAACVRRRGIECRSFSSQNTRQTESEHQHE